MLTILHWLTVDKSLISNARKHDECCAIYFLPLYQPQRMAARLYLGRVSII